MLFRFVFTVLVILMLNFDLSAQATASASISSTIETVVGAESGSILSFSAANKPRNLVSMSSDETSLSALSSIQSENSFAASFKIIGTSQLFDINVQKEAVIIHDISGVEKFRVEDFNLIPQNDVVALNQAIYKVDATLVHNAEYNSMLPIRAGNFNVIVNFN